MSRSPADRLAVAGLVLAALVAAWPLLAHPLGLPPNDDDLGLDAFNYYGFAGAARRVLLRYRQFPLRSPWHGGGYPIYANPDDLTLTPTMLLVVVLGPWAALKVDLLLTYLAAALGMFLFTRRRLGYGPAGAFMSAASFAFGGFLAARWLRGWRVVTHAAWLPLIMYALWRGRERRRWLALAALLVGWLFIDHKYVPVIMAWFLLLVGLLRPEGEDRPPPPWWGYFGRLAGVWAVGAGLAAVKLVPMLPLVWAHVGGSPRARMGPETWRAVAVWVVVLGALAAVRPLGRLLRTRHGRWAGGLGLAAAAGAVVLAAWLWAPPRLPMRLWTAAGTPTEYAGKVLDGMLGFGTWGLNQEGRPAPRASDWFRGRSPAGPVVCLLALAAVFLRPGRTWRWAVLAGFLLLLQFAPLMPRNLVASWCRLPVISLMVRRPFEPLNFYLFFVLALLAGAALEAPLRTGGHRAWRRAAWAVALLNLLYLGFDTHTRLRYTVSKPLPPADWGPYQLLDRPSDPWNHHPALLSRRNVGLIDWSLDFRDLRHAALVPSLLSTPEGGWRPNPDFGAMVSFDTPRNRARLVEFTPNRIVVAVEVSRPGILVVNQISDPDWRVDPGRLLAGSPLLAVRLERKGRYRVRFRYVPVLLFVGLGLGAAGAAAGGLLLARLARRSPAGRPNKGAEAPFGP